MDDPAYPDIYFEVPSPNKVCMPGFVPGPLPAKGIVAKCVRGECQLGRGKKPSGKKEPAKKEQEKTPQDPRFIQEDVETGS